MKQSIPGRLISSGDAASSMMVKAVRPRSIAARWVELKGHPSGFDYIRIGLSVSVLVWHSYLTAYGTPVALDLWAGPAGLILQLILPMFFSLSGYLVYGSLERNSSLMKFLALRVIRIYPALCVEVLMSALILGPIVTSFDYATYFTSSTFFSYFANTLGLVHLQLPGVFLGNPLADTVNSNLWTVPYELECYLLLSILVVLGFKRSRFVSLAMFVICTIAVMGSLYVQGKSGTPPGHLNGRVLVLCFMAGTIVSRFRDVIPYSGGLAIIALIFAIPMLRYNHIVCLAPIFIAYVTVYCGLLNPKRTVIVDSGDYSYGVYLYALPIQQTVAWALGSADTWLINVAIALPLTVLFALFSWHFVEKPFLKVKKYLIEDRISSALKQNGATKSMIHFWHSAQAIFFRMVSRKMIKHLDV